MLKEQTLLKALCQALCPCSQFFGESTCTPPPGLTLDTSCLLMSTRERPVRSAISLNESPSKKQWRIYDDMHVYIIKVKTQLFPYFSSTYFNLQR